MSSKAKDILWKGVIEDLFGDFLRFFFKNADELYDIEKGFEFLEQEMAQMQSDVKVKHPRSVDKLIKVYKKNGQEKYILIHVEIQGYNDKFFCQRMYTYFSRIIDKHKREVASIAIFTDKNKKYHPRAYMYKYQDTQNLFIFKTYKVRDQDVAELEKSDNPFAAVVLIVLLALKKSEDSSIDLAGLYINLVRRLHQKEFSQEKIDIILEFLRPYLCIESEEDFKQFEETYNSITKKQTPMGIKELAEIVLKDVGREEGKEIGQREARAQLVAELLQKTDLSVQKIADLCKVSLESVLNTNNGLHKIAS